MEQKIYLLASEEKKNELNNILTPIFESLAIQDFNKSKLTKNDLLLVLGGDGSLNYLSQIDFGFTPNILYFPMGTANDFAKTLKIPEINPTDKLILDIIKNANQVEIPLMLCNDKYFINVASGGAPARVTNSGSDLLKKATGKISYYINAIEQAISPKLHDLEFQVDGNEIKRIKTFGFTVAQGLYAGGGVKVNESVTGTFNDTFNFLTLDSINMTDYISAIIGIQKQPAELSEETLSYPCKELEIKSLDDKEIPLKLDGEDYNSKRLKFKKSERKLRFFLY